MTELSKKTIFGSFVIIMGKLYGPKNKYFQNILQNLWSTYHKLSKYTWYDYILRKPIFDHFWSTFGPFWAVLVPKMKILKELNKSCIHLPIRFPTIYDTTIIEENTFLPIFGPFLGHFGPKNENFEKTLQNLYSPPHKLSNDIWYDYIWRKPIFDHFWHRHNYAIH